MPEMLGAASAVNPFTYGKPISDPTRFFGRQREVHQVFSRLKNGEFEPSSIVGEHRIGKSSLLNYIGHSDVRNSFGLDPEQYVFVKVDLQIIDPKTNPSRLWQELLRLSAAQSRNAESKQLLGEAAKRETIDTFVLNDLFDELDQREQYTVFLLDEFEKITSNANFGPDFFYGLRSLAIGHHLSLVTSSRRELIELCHSEAIRSSPFFNIFANINLRPFSEDDARTLITTSLERVSMTFSDDEVLHVMELSGCYPYFVQAASCVLFDAYAAGLDESKRLPRLARDFPQQAIPHLRNYWQNSDVSERIVLAALALMQHQGKAGGRTFTLGEMRDVYSRSPQTLAELEKRGLVLARADRYALFSPVFSDWLVDEIADTLHDDVDYETWLRSNESVVDRLEPAVKKELGAILPRVSGKYRELFVNWASDPRNLVAVAGLVRGALGLP